MSIVTTGARAIFKINGEKVVYASNCNYNINHTLQPIDVLDRIEPIEQAETGYTVDFSCTTFRIANQSAVNLGIQPKLAEILQQPELTAEIIDSQTETTLLLIERVKMTTRSGTVDARGVFTETWNFIGIKASDEAGQ